MSAVAAPPVAALDVPELTGYPRFLRPRVAVPGVYYAGFWVRVGVNLVDAVIQALLYLIVSYVAQIIVGLVAAIAQFDSNAANTWVSLVSVAGVFLYYNTVLVARHAATPGMRFCSLRIVRADDIAQAPDGRTLYLRGVIWIVFSLTGILRILDALYIIVDPRKRSVHDLMVGTTVVRKAPTPPKLASLLCEVCGRPVDEGTLCPKHGGSLGLTLTLSGHTVSLQIAASLLAVVAIAAFLVGIVLLFTSLLVGAVLIVVGGALLRITMAMTQLRSWARWVGTATGLVIALASVAYGVALIAGSNSAGGFLFAGAAVGALIVGCLWTPETYRSFRRIP